MKLPFNKNPPDTHTISLPSVFLVFCFFFLFFLPPSLFLPFCFSLPYPPLSKDSKGCLDFECCTHLLFIQLVHSSCPPVLSASSSLIQCCLLITTEVNIISWSHGRTVDKTQCGFWARANVWLIVFFFLIPNIKRHSR